ncbi:MAG: M23 family metallopeptidase [candidate division Zixibacteria bacterium]|nr:M23 family metallopeptidase [candidate division Zixibacteria bacterium]
MARRYVTVMVVRDDQATPKRWRMPFWMYRTALVLAVLMALAPIFYVAGHLGVLVLTREIGRLRDENESLRKYQDKIVALEQSLADTRHLMSQVAELAGLDSTLLAQMYGDDKRMVTTAAPSTGRLTTAPRAGSPTSTLPRGLPAAGWISRSFSDSPGRQHDGLDIALSEGTPVVSTAAGIVTFAGVDSVFGEMVVVQDNDSIETVYGHNSKLLVRPGDTIFGGQRVALSGNTGISTAPHLHYEIRINKAAADPTPFLTHDKQNP